MCQQIITLYLLKRKNEEIPWSTLKYLIGEIIYGGKVIDSYDRRALFTYVEEYFGDFICNSYQPFSFYNNCRSNSKPLKYMEMEKKILNNVENYSYLKGEIYIIHV